MLARLVGGIRNRIEGKHKMINPIVPRKSKHSKRLRHRLFSKGINQCFYCDTKLTSKTATLEHLNRLVDGGTNHPDNLTLACRGCNSCRGEIPPQEHRNNRFLQISSWIGAKFKGLP